MARVMSSEISCRNIKVTRVRDDRGVRGDQVLMDWNMRERKEFRISPKF